MTTKQLKKWAILIGILTGMLVLFVWFFNWLTFKIYVPDDTFIFPHGKNAEIYYKAQKFAEKELKKDNPDYLKIIQAYQEVVDHFYTHSEEIGEYPPGQSTPDALILIASFYIRLGKTDEAIQALQLLIKDIPQSGEVIVAYKMLGDLYYENQNYKEALEMYLKYLSSQPPHKEVEEREKIQKKIEHIQSVLNP